MRTLSPSRRQVVLLFFVSYFGKIDIFAPVLMLLTLPGYSENRALQLAFLGSDYFALPDSQRQPVMSTREDSETQHRVFVSYLTVKMLRDG